MKIQMIDEVMEQYVETGEMSGGTLFVRKGGKLVYKNSWGIAKEDTIYRMASISKVMTLIGFMKLYEQKKVGLDDKVSRYLSEFENMMVVSDERFSGMENLMQFITKGEAPSLESVTLVPADRQLTIRDLLTHSSGLEMGLYGLIAGRRILSEGGMEDNLEKRIQRYSKFALDFQPGVGTGYSPLANFDLIARIIEVIAGKRFEEYMKQEVFEPLKMTDAAYHLSQEQKTRLIPLYHFEDGNITDVTGTPEDLETMGAIGSGYDSGAAGVYCKAEDLDHLAEMLRNNGIFSGKQFLKPETVQTIYTEHAYHHLEPEPGMEWALGVKVRLDPKRAESFATKGTYGWSGAFGTHLFVSPLDELSVSFCMNRANIGGAGSYISKKVEELVFGIWKENKG